MIMIIKITIMIILMITVIEIVIMSCTQRLPRCSGAAAVCARPLEGALFECRAVVRLRGLKNAAQREKLMKETEARR